MGEEKAECTHAAGHFPLIAVIFAYQFPTILNNNLTFSQVTQGKYSSSQNAKSVCDATGWPLKNCTHVMGETSKYINIKC